MSDNSHAIANTILAQLVAPHRYIGTEPAPIVATAKMDSADRRRAEFQAYKAWVPYREGDVIYVERCRYEGANQVWFAALARVVRVFVEYNDDGNLRERYRVQFATKKGEWSRAWEYTHPGHVQRGYQLAGLAPDMPARVG